MNKETKYRIKNWSEYNNALKQRGSLTIWFDKDITTAWYNKKRTGQKGHPIVYSDLAIQCCLTLKIRHSQLFLRWKMIVKRNLPPLI